jgi:hypothetical protein
VADDEREIGMNVPKDLPVLVRDAHVPTADKPDF